MRMIRRLAQIFPSARVLEVGCDHGVMVRMLEAYGVVAHGIDVNDDAVQLASHPRITRGSADNIPYPEVSFDSCIASHVIEHLEDPDALIRETARVLRPGGTLVLLYPWEIFRGMTVIPDVLWDNKPWRMIREIHRHVFTPKKIQELAARFSFAHVRTRLFWGFPYLVPQFITVLRKS